MTRIWVTGILGLAGILLCSCEQMEGPGGPAFTRGEIAKFPLAYQSDFQSPTALADWQPTEPEIGKIGQEGGTTFLSLCQVGKHKPPVPAPRYIAFLKDHYLKSFVLDVRVQSTSPDSLHHSIVVVFNYQNPTQYYYVELGPKAEPDAHSIFVVDGRPSLAIAEKQDPGIKWDNGWHHVRIVRIVEDGRIEVYFDDMKTSIMTANDQRLDVGLVGLGSFEDLGNFDDLKITGFSFTKADMEKSLPFRPPTTRPATQPATAPAPRT